MDTGLCRSPPTYLNQLVGKSPSWHQVIETYIAGLTSGKESWDQVTGSTDRAAHVVPACSTGIECINSWH